MNVVNIESKEQYRPFPESHVLSRSTHWSGYPTGLFTILKIRRLAVPNGITFVDRGSKIVKRSVG